MGCQIQKCIIPECPNKMKACQLINGMCVSCYSKQQQEIKKAEAARNTQTGQ